MCVWKIKYLKGFITKNKNKQIRGSKEIKGNHHLKKQGGILKSNILLYFLLINIIINYFNLNDLAIK